VVAVLESELISIDVELDAEINNQNNLQVNACFVMVQDCVLVIGVRVKFDEQIVSFFVFRFEGVVPFSCSTLFS